MEKDNFSCCACCCSCCVISVYNVVLSIISLIMSLIVYVCIVSLIVWIMFRSNAVKFRIDDTKLTRFDLDIGNNNLHYNLSLSFSIRNSNRLIGIHYDRFQAMVYYSDKRLASVFVPPFYQGHKNTTVVETLFQGQNLVLVGGKRRKKFEDDRKFDRDFEDDRKIGVYGIDVKVRIRSRGMLWPLMTWPMKPIIRCHLKVQLLGSSNSTGGFDFKSTMCSLKF